MLFGRRGEQAQRFQHGLRSSLRLLATAVKSRHTVVPAMDGLCEHDGMKATGETMKGVLVTIHIQAVETSPSAVLTLELHDKG